VRNLIQFIWRNQFVILFLLLEVFAFTILIRYNNLQNANFLGFTNEITGNAFDALNDATEYLELKEVNQSLARENAELRGSLPEYLYALDPKVRFINDSSYLLQHEYLEARVINNTIGRRNNYITLNHGSIHGVKPEMGVVSHDGLIGVVNNVSEHYSSVISILHKNTRVSVKLKHNDFFGILTWGGGNPRVADLEDIPSHVNISKGDTIVTRGSGGIYPPGKTVGFVKSFEEIEGTDFYEITVDLSMDLQQANYVYVVRNLLRMEQEDLESLNSEEND
jgi:rod shape-determining protein MreC